MSRRGFYATVRDWFTREATAPTVETPELTVESVKQSSTQSTFLSDSPVGKDHFGRSPFARALARALILPQGSDGLVVGIEGIWGSGKTFVINQIKAFLAEEKSPPIVVDFNPWVISGTDSVVEALLEQLSSAIGEDPDPRRKEAALKAGSSVLRYLSLVRHLKYLKYAPGLNAFGAAAEDLANLAEDVGKSVTESVGNLEKLANQIPKHNLMARKDIAIGAIADLGRPIVVILDDLDRLPPEEIRSVVQAVKAVANFPRTAYLLSYDPNIAAKALDRDISVGLTYIEKIVQVTYPLPPPLPWRMHAFAVSKLRETLAATQRKLTDDEEARFGEVTSYIARLCSTPRDVIRTGNRLRISLPATENEVDACDVMLLEAIGICEPAIDRAIRRYPDDFTESARVDFESFGHEFYFAQATERVDKERTDEKKEENWRKHVMKPVSLYVEGALRYLFPSEAVRSTGSLRVQNWERLYRFLALGPAEHITELRDLARLISNESALQDALNGDDKSALSILRSAEFYVGALRIPDTSRLVESLCSFSAQRLRKGNNDWRDLASQYADVIGALIRTINGSLRGFLFERAIDIAPISVSQALLTSAASDLGKFEGRHEQPAGHRLIEDTSTYQHLVARWVTRVDELFRMNADLRDEPLIYAALYRLGQLGGDYETARAISKYLVEHGDLRRFLQSTQLTGEFPVSMGHLDIIWNREELVRLIEQDTKNAERYSKALELLRSEQAIDYFARRTTKPTTHWPPKE